MYVPVDYRTRPALSGVIKIRFNQMRPRSRVGPMVHSWSLGKNILTSEGAPPDACDEKSMT